MVNSNTTSNQRSCEKTQLLRNNYKSSTINNNYTYKTSHESLRMNGEVKEHLTKNNDRDEDENENASSNENGDEFSINCKHRHSNFFLFKSWRRLKSLMSRKESELFMDITYYDCDDEEEGPEHASGYNVIDNDDIGINVDGVTLNVDQDGKDEINILFLQFFFTSKGPPQIVLLSMLVALALGSTIGVAPAVLSNKYATLYHGLDDTIMTCADYKRDDKPQACLDGSNDAQSAAAAASFFSNVFTFLTSSWVGALSDENGRRNFIILAQFLACLSPCVLVLLQVSEKMAPIWYYSAYVSGSLISWTSVALSSLSDIMPKQWRAAMFGLLLSGFSLGFALSPILAIFCTHFVVSVLSLFIIVLSFLYSVCCLPETLPPEQATEARLKRMECRSHDNESKLHYISQWILRPFKELSILNRNDLFRLLSVLAFFSGMSTSADQTLLIYYLEGRLEFNDQDIAIYFGIFGIFGIIVQGILLKHITDLVGERYVVMIAFICGAMTNILYALASTKQMIFFTVVISSFIDMSFPTISAIKANNADGSEQGRIQGALYALSSLASALGPVVLRFAYQETMNTKYPGLFFLVATVFYIVAVFCGYALPTDKSNSETSSSSSESGYNEVALIETTETTETTN